MKIRCRFFLIGHLLGFLSLVTLIPARAQDTESRDEFEYHETRRINAHGDEFMALALSPDERYLFIGTEKGEIIVWHVAEQRVIRRLVQGSAVHAVVALKDGRHIVAAGGPHTGQTEAAVVRRWNIETGKYEDLSGAGKDSLFYLALSEDGKTIAAVSWSYIATWETDTGRLLATRKIKQLILAMTLAQGELYTVLADPQWLESEEESPGTPIMAFSLADLKRAPREVVPAQRGRIWSSLRASPDGKRLAAVFNGTPEPRLTIAGPGVTTSAAVGPDDWVMLLDVAKGAFTANVSGRAVAWATEESLLVFGQSGPVSQLAIAADGATRLAMLKTEGKFHGNGSPDKMMGQVATRDGKRGWNVFQLNAALVGWDLTDKDKKGELLLTTNGFPFALDAWQSAGKSGWLATVGDDKFVRVWRLSDLSLYREFQVPVGVPQGVALSADGRHIVYSCSSKESPTEIYRANLDTGLTQKILTVKQPFVGVYPAGADFIYYQDGNLILASATGETKQVFTTDAKPSHCATSRNGRWLAVSDKEGVVSVFEIATNQRRTTRALKVDDLKHLAVTDDGRYVYTTEWAAHLRRWETRGDTWKDLGTIRGQAACLRLSTDEKYLVIGGNHRDIGVYEAKTGRRVSYLRLDSADFYITNAWLDGTRLIFTTDTGVMYDGQLRR